LRVLTLVPEKKAQRSVADVAEAAQTPGLMMAVVGAAIIGGGIVVAGFVCRKLGTTCMHIRPFSLSL
jgi:hypothetical protein